MSLLYTVYFTQFVIHSLLYTVCCTQFVVHSLLYTVYCTQFIVHSLLYTVCCTQFIVHSLLCTVCCTQFVVHSLFNRKMIKVFSRFQAITRTLHWCNFWQMVSYFSGTKKFFHEGSKHVHNINLLPSLSHFSLQNVLPNTAQLGYQVPKQLLASFTCLFDTSAIISKLKIYEMYQRTWKKEHGFISCFIILFLVTDRREGAGGGEARLVQKHVQQQGAAIWLASRESNKSADTSNFYSCPPFQTNILGVSCKFHTKCHIWCMLTLIYRAVT